MLNKRLKGVSVKFKSFLTSVAVSFVLTSSLVYASDITAQKLYNQESQKCEEKFGNEISMQKSQCINRISVEQAEMYDYTNMDLVHDANTKRLEFTQKVLNKEMSPAQMRFAMKSIYRDMHSLTSYKNDAYFLVHSD